MNSVQLEGTVVRMQNHGKLTTFSVKVEGLQFGNGSFQVKCFNECNFTDGAKVRVVGKLRYEEYPKGSKKWSLTVVADEVIETVTGEVHEPANQQTDLPW